MKPAGCVHRTEARTPKLVTPTQQCLRRYDPLGLARAVAVLVWWSPAPFAQAAPGAGRHQPEEHPRPRHAPLPDPEAGSPEENPGSAPGAPRPPQTVSARGCHCVRFTSAHGLRVRPDQVRLCKGRGVSVGAAPISTPTITPTAPQKHQKHFPSTVWCWTGKHSYHYRQRGRKGRGVAARTF